MSVWLQTKGEFFWVFTWDGEDFELYKVMGETAPFSVRGGQASGFVSTMQMYSCCHCHCKKNHCLFFSSMHSCLNGLQTMLKFFAYDVKPVPVRSMRFSSWRAKSGLFAKDTLVFLFLSCICSIQHGCTLAGGRPVLCPVSPFAPPSRQPQPFIPKAAHVALQDMAGLHPADAGDTGRKRLLFILICSQGMLFLAFCFLVCAQAFQSNVQRSQPHWTSTGDPNSDSWDGWVWSYGNGCWPELTCYAFISKSSIFF